MAVEVQNVRRWQATCKKCKWKGELTDVEWHAAQEQKAHDIDMHRGFPRPRHASIGDILAILGDMPEDEVFPIGFDDPQAYRMSPHDVAFVVRENISVKAMKLAVTNAKNSRFEGWKGGDYYYNDDSNCWLIESPGEPGETIGMVFLAMLASTRYKLP